MGEEHKLNLKTTAADCLCVTFTNIDGDCCVVEESKDSLRLGNDNQDYVGLARINRSQAASVARALMRFAIRGTLAEPSCEERVTESIKLDNKTMARLLGASGGKAERTDPLAAPEASDIKSTYDLISYLTRQQDFALKTFGQGRKRRAS